MITTLGCLLFLFVVFAVIYGPAWFYRYRNRRLYTRVPKSDSVTLTNTPPEKGDYAKGGVLTPDAIDKIRKRHLYGQPDQEGYMFMPGYFSPEDQARMNPEISSPQNLMNRVMISSAPDYSLALRSTDALPDDSDERRRQKERDDERERRRQDEDAAMNQTLATTLLADSLLSDNSSSSYSSGSSSDDIAPAASDPDPIDFGGGDFGGGGGGSDY